MNKVELYYQVAHSHLLEQDARHRKLEVKVGSILGFGAALIGVSAFTVDQWSRWSLIPGVGLLSITSTGTAQAEQPCFEPMAGEFQSPTAPSA